MGETKPTTSDVFQGDCVEILSAWPDNSIDAVVTDPPYGIGFMGKEWDTFKPGVAETRVIENEERDTTENPNVKGRQRRPASSPSAVEYDRSVGGQRAFQDWTARWAREAFRVLKPGGHMVVFGAPRSAHRMACGLEDAGFEVRDTLAWMFGQGFPKSLDVSKAIDKASGATRATTYGRALENTTVTGDAAQWSGWGTALKPAYEPIVLARKPLEGTVVANVQRWGTGAINVDGCRIATTDNLNGGAYSGGARPTSAMGCTGEVGGTHSMLEAGGGRLCPDAFTTPSGRWPANLVHDGSDEALAVFPATAGASSPVRGDEPSPASVGQITGARARVPGVFHGDAGSAARFFYQAKTSTGERNYGCDHLPDVSAGAMTGGRQEDSAGLKSPRAGAGRGGGGKNAHATVKPIRLMRWLCRLITPPGGIILDPFVGSGTTGIAADLEGFSFIGIDKDPQWVQLAETRIAAWMCRPDGEAVTRP